MFPTTLNGPFSVFTGGFKFQQHICVNCVLNHDYLQTRCDAFTVIKDEGNQEIFTLEKLEPENYRFRFIDYQTNWRFIFCQYTNQLIV